MTATLSTASPIISRFISFDDLNKLNVTTPNSKTNVYMAGYMTKASTNCPFISKMADR